MGKRFSNIYASLFLQWEDYSPYKVLGAFANTEVWHEICGTVGTVSLIDGLCHFHLASVILRGFQCRVGAP